jgi:DNA-binding transcriptional MerR regulator
MADDTVDRALVEALAGPVPGEGEEHDLTLDELAERAGLPVALVEALEREQLLLPRVVDGKSTYSSADADLLAAGMALLEAGVPLDELLSLARRHEQAMRAMATEAVELFVRFVRDPIQGSAASDEEASEQLVTAFGDMLPATGAIISHHFRRLLLAAANERLGEP